MRVGVIRGDIPGPILLADLEPVSRYNPPTEPRGQEVYISRPTIAEVEGVLASSTVGAGAVMNGGNISGAFPLTITLGLDDTLLFRVAPTGAYTTIVIAAAVYANLTDLVAAINTAIGNSIGITARTNVAGNGVALESNTRGVDSFIDNDSSAGGSTANIPLSLPDGVGPRTMPTAATYITATLPVGGPLNVSVATINAVGAGTASAALSLIPTSRGTQEALADAVAPQFIESTIAIDCFLVGYMADLLSANFNPDPERLGIGANGPGITVVQDDGVSLFAATLPIITTADLGTPAPGDLTITGTGLGDFDRDETMIKLTGTINTTLLQRFIVAAGGSVSDTSIFIPAAMIPGAVITTTSAQVQVRQRVSGVSVLV